MRLTVVGCAGSTAGPDSAASCYLVETEVEGRTWRVVLDLGSGAIGPLQRFCDPATVDAVVVSHGHPDHCADLAALSVLRRYGPRKDGALAPIPLYGPPGLDQRIVQIAGSHDDHDLDPFSYTPVAGGDRVEVGPFVLDFADAWHPIPAVAVRVTGPSVVTETGSLVFTGDTDVCEPVLELARDADLLLAEAGWAHQRVNPEGIHMNGTQAGTLARDAAVGELVLTHVASWVDPTGALELATAAYGAPAALATPGEVYVI
ncbi:MBL fold metallo-hydrolase [Demequina sp. SYSU T00039]|uniref:MBL fold metallo-hydrolase n=1 Tax=Demequina lignilytica TaxID=3051663 RepID=A0AAW7M8X2_9MICO|nr:MULTISPECIES: MBL fold metallo-hydrolase [unclassified Demequina]MDN4478888.1 MBL fold metallo-hydrolase [Demequina sp. SYSU T00039-1]MDN4488763.1 MBL fold metallo-hydrolase [Demequina sp. SYSU T00039]MDN4491853.1 MBL fold metallo-hydrolase [Demequina sp. SYSU T00068]